MKFRDMREIKFRGYSSGLEKWHYGSLVCLPSHSMDTCAVRDIVEEDGSKHPVGKVGQYTTLKDKNGTEIYEGDIIQLDHPSWNYIVFWDDDSLSFQYRKVGSKQAYQLAMTELQLRQYEVVGNIYDNPELLKDDVQ